MLFAETSAKTAAGVSTVFEMIAEKFAGPATSGDSTAQAAPAPAPPS